MATTAMAAPREKNNILSLKNSITDEDIVFPESFDTDVHKMMTNWYLQNYAVLDADVENKCPTTRSCASTSSATSTAAAPSLRRCWV